MQSIAPASFSKAYEVIPQIWRTEIYTVPQIIQHNAEVNSGVSQTQVLAKQKSKKSQRSTQIKIPVRY